MTIRFLQPWGGYQIGDRASLASATETGLKAAGLARDDYTQDGPVSGIPVTATPSGPGLEIQDGSDTRSFVTAEMSGGVPTGNFS